MHHYGCRSLDLMGSYMAKHEENRHDPFAVVVFDGTRKVANLKRDSARVLYDILITQYPKSDVYLRPTDVASVSSQRIGPQQSCAVVFKCKIEDVESVKTLVARPLHQLSGVYVKMMDLPQKGKRN